MDETSKTLLMHGRRLAPFLEGRGIDIGCGPDPVTPGCRGFDLTDGDAERIDEYVDEEFDFVWSSHCLEHMSDPRDALRRWWTLVRPGGHLILIVPDEDLYEQGFWPSVFNGDHKASFRLRGPSEWSPVSVDLEHELISLGALIRILEVQDDGIVTRHLAAGPDRVSGLERIFWGGVALALRVLRVTGAARLGVTRRRGRLVDQTAIPDGRLAQICAVMQKPGP